MQNVSREQLSVLAAIAQEIVADAFERGEPDYTKNYCEDHSKAGLPYVAMRRAEGVISDLAAVHASCPGGKALQINMPFKDRHLEASKAKRPTITRTVFSALVHELIHVRQCAADPNKYRATVARQAEIEKGDPSYTPGEWLEKYYGDELELEAHAAQLAADEWFRGRCMLIAEPYGNWVRETEIGRRVLDRLLPDPKKPDDDAVAWWQRLVATAVKYESLWAPPSTEAEAEGTEAS